MPRTGRVDSPGAIQHLLVRGLERRRLFKDAKDYGEFIRRLSGALEDTGAHCLGWALMPNHVHLVTRTGHRSISKMMQILLSGYGLYFNRRYKRSGYLYQGRFKSLLVEEEGYFLVLVRYVHLNPLKGGVVQSLAALERYRWAGHGVLMGKRKASWQETAEVLGRFGRTRRSQRKAYRTFMREGLRTPWRWIGEGSGSCEPWEASGEGRNQGPA